MTAIRTNGMDAERELLDNVIDKIDCALLVMPSVDLQRADASGVIDGGELITTDFLAVLRGQGEELHVYLDLMTRNLLGVTTGMDCSPSNLARQTPDPVALERAVDARRGSCKPLVALEVPRDSLRPEVILGTQVQDLLDEFRRDLSWVASGHWLFAHQPRSTLFGVGFLPSVE